MHFQLRRSFVSSTRPNNMKHHNNNNNNTSRAKLKSRADLFPIYILFGFTGGAVFLAVKSVTQQLFHHPGVHVNKTNRSMVPEVDTPDTALASGDKFITKSVLRKVAHIQQRDDIIPVDRRTPDIYKSRRSDDSTTLKTVGVEPRR
ncbi:hypothetical protein L6452_21399 [Arctium lappa]|uniref:Uncharacterized protein n=1 Tax=Arctium lappa TaxID=4217 RepID=A0ACB9BFB0_ARCLA|nr:hypothetical protein L6452_21399 [Arctium lappa]